MPWRRRHAVERPRARPDPGPRPRLRGDRVRARVARPRPPPRRPRPRRPRRARRPPPGPRAWTRAPCCSPSSARRTSPRATPSTSSTTPTSSRTRSPAPGRGAAVLRIKGTTKALVATTDGNAPVGAAGPVARAPRCPSPRPRATCRSPARGRSASPTASTTATRPAPRPSGSSPRASAGSATRAGRSACRSPAATSRLYNEAPGVGRSRRRPRSASSACSTTSGTLVGPAFRADGDPVLLVGEAGPGLAGSEYARLAGVAPEDGPPALDLDRERRLQALHPRGHRPRPRRARQDVSGGGLAVALAEQALWSGIGAQVRLPVGDSPAVDLFGESPSPARRGDAAAPRRGARAARPPARPAGRGDRDHRRRRGWSSSSAGVAARPGAAEERGSGIADALEVPVADLRHAWEHGLPRALGWDEAATDGLR